MTFATDPKTEALVKLYMEAERNLSLIIAGAIENGSGGTAAYYKGQRRAIVQLLTDLSATAIPQATELVSGAYVNGALSVEKLLGINGGFTGVHVEAVDLLADNLTQRLDDATRTVGRRVDGVLRKQALEAVTRGLMQGSSRVDVSDSLQANLKREGITAFQDKSGRRWGLENYTRMVARTTTREAVTEGTANRMIENGQDLVTISSHANPADICKPYEGNTYSLTGATKGYEILDQKPPFHPQCRHVMMPATATLDALEKSLRETNPEAFRSVSS